MAYRICRRQTLLQSEGGLVLGQGRTPLGSAHGRVLHQALCPLWLLGVAMTRPTVHLRAWTDDHETRLPGVDPTLDDIREWMRVEGHRMMLAPDTCPTCHGSGREAPTCGKECDCVCSTCGGRGYVWPARLVAPIAAELAEMERVPESWRLDKARRVLDVLWEVGND